MNNIENKNRIVIFIVIIVILLIGVVSFIIIKNTKEEKSFNNTTITTTESTTTITTKSAINNEENLIKEALDRYLEGKDFISKIESFSIKLYDEMDISEYCDSEVEGYGKDYTNQIQRDATIIYTLKDGNKHVGEDFAITGNDDIVGDHIEADGVFVFEKTSDGYKVISLWTGCGGRE